MTGVIMNNGLKTFGRKRPWFNSE